jgi:alpha-tubulin suppressor-like RCC1 family protein
MRLLVSFAVLAVAACSLSVDYTGTFFPCGENESCPDNFFCTRGVCVPTEPDPPSCSSAIAAGSNHSCMVRDTDGTVWCWGRNNEGQLGNNTTIDSSIPVQVEGITGASTVVTGAQYSCAIVAGTVECWGANDEGQLGDGSQTGSRTPVAASGLTGVTALAAGEQHTCAIGAGGAVSCWGFNTSGQLGDGTMTSRRVPGSVPGVTATAIAASDDSTCVVEGSALTCWGFNGEGLFMNGTTMSTPEPVSSTLLTGIAGVSIGGGHLCVFTDTGEVHCAGDNGVGQLGDGNGAMGLTSSLPVRAFIPGKVIAISAGDRHTCAVDDTGGAWCWGADGGKLGLGFDLGSVRVPVKTTFEDIATIAAGGGHTCARSTSGAIACAGFNGMGQLGNGDRITQTSPKAVPDLAGIAAIASGGNFTCALDTVGAATCWGNGLDGELGDGAFHVRPEPGPVLLTDIDQLVAGTDHVCGLRADGTVSCWGLGTSGQLGDGTFSSRGVPVPVEDLSGVTQLALGSRHSCALVASAVKCWGSNDSGQLGMGPTSSAIPIDVIDLLDAPILQIAAGASHTCALDSRGEVQCWGAGFIGQLGTSNTNATPTPAKVLRLSTGTVLTEVDEIFARGDNTFARVGGTIFGWGYGCDARLGSNEAQCSATVAAVPVADIATAAQLAIGFTSSCALKADASVACWGQNYFGQLGDGTYNTTNPVPVPGLSGVIDISAGGEHVCAVKNDATVVCWGGAHAGALGDGVVEDRGPNFVRFSCN